MKIQKIDKNGKRFYKINNMPELASVTTILGLLPKEGLMYWVILQTLKYLDGRRSSVKMSSQAYVFYKKVLDDVSKEGTDIHNLIEKYLMDGETKDDKHKTIKRFKDWEAESGFKVISVEETLYSKEYRSAGTADLIGKCGDQLIIIDLKTSKSLRLSHKIQTTIYKDMYCDLNNIDRNKVKSGVLLIPRDKVRTKNFYINTFDEEEKYRKIYKCLAYLFYTLVNLEEIKLV